MAAGRQVSASSELVYLEASPTEVVLTECDLEPPTSALFRPVE